MAHLRILRSRLNLFSVSTPLTTLSHQSRPTRCQCLIVTDHLHPSTAAARPRRHPFSTAARTNKAQEQQSSGKAITTTLTEVTTPSPSTSRVTVDATTVRRKISGPALQAKRLASSSWGRELRVETPKVSKYRVDCNTSKVIKRKKKFAVDIDPKKTSLVVKVKPGIPTIVNISQPNNGNRAERRARAKADAKAEKMRRQQQVETITEETTKIKGSILTLTPSLKEDGKTTSKLAAATLEPTMIEMDAGPEGTIAEAGRRIARSTSQKEAMKIITNAEANAKKAPVTKATAAGGQPKVDDASGAQPHSTKNRTAFKWSEPALSSFSQPTPEPASRSGLAKLPRPPSFNETVSAIDNGLPLPPATTAPTLTKTPTIPSSASESASTGTAAEESDSSSVISPKQFVDQLRSTLPSQRSLKFRRTDFRTILDWSIHPTVMPSDFGSLSPQNTILPITPSSRLKSHSKKVATQSSATTKTTTESKVAPKVPSPAASNLQTASSEASTIKSDVASGNGFEATRTRSRRRIGFEALDEADNFDHGRDSSRSSLRLDQTTTSFQRTSSPPRPRQQTIIPSYKKPICPTNDIARRIAVEQDVKTSSPPAPIPSSSSSPETMTPKKIFSRHRRIGFGSLEEDTTRTTKASSSSSSSSKSGGSRFAF